MDFNIAIIAAVARNNVIGFDGSIPWNIPEDLRRFRNLTMGHPVIMGRRTFESIGKPLEGREMIVVSSRIIQGFMTTRSLSEALGKSARPVFLIGGSRIYSEGMLRADTIFLTEVNLEPSGNTFFPPIPSKFIEISRENGKNCNFVVLRR